jgi:hypothetical protein
MILTTAKNQQKHSDELFVRNSCIWALQMCILATWTIGKHWIKLVVLQQWLLYVCSPHRCRPKLLLASSFVFTTISYYYSTFKCSQRSSTCAKSWVLCTAAAQEARPPSSSPVSLFAILCIRLIGIRSIIFHNVT